MTWITNRWNIWRTIWLGHWMSTWTGHHGTCDICVRNHSHASWLALNCLVRSSTQSTIVGFSLACINVSMKNETDSWAAMHVISPCISNVWGIWPQICHMKLQKQERKSVGWQEYQIKNNLHNSEAPEYKII